MLETLESVDWASLSHAYGSAADIPSNLRKLAGPPGDERSRAVGSLLMSICHQGSVYSASAAAMPFLFELLEHAPGEKSDIAWVAACVASGVGYFELYAKGNCGRCYDDIGDVLAELGMSLEEASACEATELAPLRRTASARLLDLLPYLQSAVRECRLAVAEALGEYPEHARATLPKLEAAAAAERDERVSEAIAGSVAQLKKHVNG